MKSIDIQKLNVMEKQFLQQTIRKSELRKLVPLADTTIYQMEQRGEFPKRFNLSPRCVVWSLVEVENWIEQCRQNSKFPSASDRPALMYVSGNFAPSEHNANNQACLKTNSRKHYFKRAFALMASTRLACGSCQRSKHQ